MKLLNVVHEKMCQCRIRVTGAVKRATASIQGMLKRVAAFVADVVGRAVSRVIMLVLTGVIIALLGGLDGLVNVVLTLIKVVF